MAQTLSNGVVVPDGDGDEQISATGVQEMRNLGASVDAQLGNRALVGHTHPIAGVVGLQSALDGKSTTSHTHSWAQITSKPSAFPPATHTHDARYYTQAQIDTRLDAIYLSGAITHEWVGEPHASESIKRVSGVEVARNYATNPSFETSATAAMSISNLFSPSQTGSSATQGALALHLMLNEDATGTTWVHQGLPEAKTGSWVAFRIDMIRAVLATGSRDAFFSIRLRFLVGGSWVYTDNTHFATATYGGPAKTVAPIPDGTTEAHAMLYLRGASLGATPLAGDQWWTDGWQVVTADTEVEALAHVESYWDGDTPDVTRLDLLEARVDALTMALDRVKHSNVQYGTGAPVTSDAPVGFYYQDVTADTTYQQDDTGWTEI